MFKEIINDIKANPLAFIGDVAFILFLFAFLYGALWMGAILGL